jgi:hypothetical protein
LTFECVEAAYAPAGHSAQATVAAGEKVPAVQARQRVAPATTILFLSAALLPEAVNDPAPHIRQATVDALENQPARQELHCWAPPPLLALDADTAEAAYDPAGHAAQAKVGARENWPALQGTQRVAPATRCAAVPEEEDNAVKEPGSHCTHPAADDPAEYHPAAHRLQCVAPVAATRSALSKEASEAV